MKNILVPTDFSDCAEFALEFAFCMSEIYDANVHVLHNVAEKKGIWATTKSEKEAFHENVEIERLLKFEFSKLTESSPINKQNLKTYHTKGDLVENITQFIQEKAIDFVVMGSHGASGKKEFFVGSNTQKVVRAISCPVFVVKNSAQNFKIDKVVFASNFTLSTVASLDYALEFLKPFGPEVHLVEVNTPGYFSQPYTLEKEVLNDFKQICISRGFKCEAHFYKDLSVDAGVRHITEKLEADLIIVSNETRHPLRRFLRGSNVEFIVNHAEVPVLSIDLK